MYSSDDDKVSVTSLTEEELADKQLEDRRKIYEVFNKYDPKHTDYMPVDSFRDAMADLGETISEK